MSSSSSSSSAVGDDGDELEYCDYTDESMLNELQAMVSIDLSEPFKPLIAPAS
jgi:hypothetical protein